MFGLLYEMNDDRYFKIYKTQEDAMIAAKHYAFIGYKVTVFDYDKDNDTYIDFYTI